MSEERRRVLDMLSEGKISAPEAEELLRAMGGGGEPQDGAAPSQAAGDGDTALAKPKPKFLRVLITRGEEGQAGDRVDVRVPLALVRAGVKLNTLIPQSARGQVDAALQQSGISLDLTGVDAKTIDELVDALADLRVEVQSRRGETVRVFCE